MCLQQLREYAQTTRVEWQQTLGIPMLKYVSTVRNSFFEMNASFDLNYEKLADDKGTIQTLWGGERCGNLNLRVDPLSGLKVLVSSGGKRKVAEALAGAHFPGAQDQVVWVERADGVAVLREVELDGGRGVAGFEPADLGLADSAQFFQGINASASVGVKIG